jgi:hypothetical protein
MAWEEGQGLDSDLNFKAAADLRALQYTFVKLDANGNVIACAAAGEKSIGVLQNKPNTGETAVVRPHGLSKLVASAAVAANDFVTTDAAGKGKTATRLVAATGTASNVHGYALRAAGGANVIFTAFLSIPGGIWPTVDA